MNNIPLARDLALKRTVHAPVDQKPLYAWRDVIAPSEISLPPIVLLCPHGEERFDLTEVADPVGGIAARAKDVVRIDYQGGNATRRGRWMVPQRMEIRAVGGTVKLDFTDAVITGPTLYIQAEVRGGRLVLVTKPGIEVDTDDVAVHGGRVRVRPEHGWKEPACLTVEVSGEARGGNLVVRPPHRTFRQWLLRRPRPYARSASD